MLPLIPDTPIPPAPIVATLQPTTNANNFSGNLVASSVHNTQSIALAPPPFQNSRRANTTVSANNFAAPVNGNGMQSTSDIFSLNDVFNRERQGPDVGRRLQNLQIDKMEDLFDDEFDPRAGEKKKTGKYISQICCLLQ